jgi:hypothetical protein
MDKKILMAILLLTVVSFGQVPRFKLIGACDIENVSYFDDCYDVVVLDTLAFLACADLPVINIARPDSPFVVTKIDTLSGRLQALCVFPPYLFSIGWNSRGNFLKAFDISNLPGSILLDSIVIPTYVTRDMASQSGYLYFSADSLRLADAVNPESLHYLGVIDSVRFAGRLSIGNNYLYELVSACSLLVYDLINPSNPQKIGSCPLPGYWVSEPFYRDSLIYYPQADILSGNISLHIVNVADPFNPFHLATSPGTGADVQKACDIAVSGKFAYATMCCYPVEPVAKKHRLQEPAPQIAIFDISDPANPFPVWINEYDYRYYYSGIDSRGDTIYFCNGDSFYIYVDSLWTGIEEEPFIPNPEIVKFQVYPNPFSKLINIKFQAPNSKSQVTMRIYDATGRLVRDFADDLCNHNKSVKSVCWDGRDDKGNMLETGVYFILLIREGLNPIRQKVVFLK